MATSINEKALTELGASKRTLESPSRRVVWLVAGEAKTGKTHLALDAPGPLGYLNIDMGEEGTIEKFLAAGKDVWGVDIRVTRQMTSDPNAEVVKAKCEPELMRSLRAFDEMVLGDAGRGLRSVIVDTWTEFFQLGCLARIGKDKQIIPVERTKVNGIYSSLIHSSLYGDKNVILLGKTKTYDGETSVVGYNQSEGLVQTVIMTGRKKKLEKVDGKMQQKEVFTYTIQHCRQNKDLNGETFDSDELGEHPFAQLAAMIVPNTKPRDWR